jgi:hypothetical protein
MKYKQKYLGTRISDKPYQKAGSAALYVRGYSRTDMDRLSLKDQKYIIDESLASNRYFHRYRDINNELLTEGIDMSLGPGGREEAFAIENYVEYVEVDVDMYESWLIYEYLVRINRNLVAHGISTTQSQISYYSKDCEFIDTDYFQNPFLTFAGDVNSIPVLKKMMMHPLAKDLLFFSYYDTRFDASDPMSHLTSITFVKRVFNEEGEFIFTFDDTDFWKTMEKISEDAKLEKVAKSPVFTGNDPDLDESKDWYVIDDDANVVKITDKTKEHPFGLNNLPLTILNVRYVDDINEFTKVYSLDPL